jgi:hypothetical protein
MDVSVCIVNWNTRELLRRCLASIALHTQGLRHEVIVVDNQSADGSTEMVRRDFPGVRLIEPGANLGFARGSNLAAHAATGDHILYLNPDTELVTNALLGLWRALDEDAACGAVGCRLLNSDGSVQLTCAADIPSPRNELTSMLMLDRLFPRSRLFAARELAWWDHAQTRDVACLSGACLMARRSLIARIGGFDESLFMYGEDVDLCCRIRAEGLALRYLASETIFHHEGAASRKKGRSFAPLRQRAANTYVLAKNFGSRRALAYRAAVLLGSAARLSGAVLLTPVAVLRGRRHQIVDFAQRHADLLLWSVGARRIPAP